jgi:hypothetical protein
MFEALTTYKQIYGHCNVPRKWKDNPALGNWCHAQRRSWSAERSRLSARSDYRTSTFLWACAIRQAIATEANMQN